MKSMCWKCNGIRDIDTTISKDGTIDIGYAACTCGGDWQPVGGT